MNLRDTVQRTDTPAGRTFDFVVLFLIAFSIVTLSIDTLPDLSPVTKRFLDVSEVVITAMPRKRYPFFVLPRNCSPDLGSRTKNSVVARP